MAPRERVRVGTRPKGTATRNGLMIGGYDFQDRRHFCADQTGPGDCAPFTVESWELTRGTINTVGSPSHGRIFRDYIADVFNSKGSFPCITDVYGQLDNTAYAAKLAARTNPSRPYVDLPVAVFELPDIIRIVRDTGRMGLKKRNPYSPSTRGSDNLRNEFWIAPIVSDLKKIMNFNEAVFIRLDELRRLGSDKGFRRTVDLGSFAVAGKGQVLVPQSQYAAFNGMSWDYTATVTIRGHARWRAGGGLPVGDPKLFALAKKAMLGLTWDVSTTWELLPWSWLLDWGTTLGDYFKATRNIVPASLVSLNIMREYSTRWQAPSVRSSSFPDIIMDYSEVNAKRKERRPASLSPTAHFPFLDRGKAGILSSLATSKGRYSR